MDLYNICCLRLCEITQKLSDNPLSPTTSPKQDTQPTYNFPAPSPKTVPFSHRARIEFTSSGFSHSAQCDVSTCFRLSRGTTRAIFLPRCGGRAGSLRAWMKRTGTVMRWARMACSSE